MTKYIVYVDDLDVLEEIDEFLNPDEKWDLGLEKPHVAIRMQMGKWLIFEVKDESNSSSDDAGNSS
jgi:hypothetical protein